MYKIVLILIFVVGLMAACTPSEAPVDTLQQAEQNQDQAQTIKELEEKNQQLQEQINQLQVDVNSEEIRNNLRETLNMTFKLIAAMESGDTAYMKSISSPNVEISQDNKQFIIVKESHSYEVNFISGLAWDEFEFRGYDQTDSDHFMLFIAHYNYTEGSEGHAAYEFSFVRSPEGEWLFDGYNS
ncbi:bZIP transcription factor [Paenibacillus xylanexedens]|uniref:bZIP transcription factor n=1 Tax=Paenibacillus xylanexedens TaxID=528191 RepID=UPI0011A49B82|nr:hypothetical protein [Paenibacillus xylanexedens]